PTSTCAAPSLLDAPPISLYSNFYLGQIVDSGGTFKTEIYKNVGGVFTLLATGTTVGTGAGTLEFEAVGQSLKLIFNGAVVAFAVDMRLASVSVGQRLSQT